MVTLLREQKEETNELRKEVSTLKSEVTAMKQDLLQQLSSGSSSSSSYICITTINNWLLSIKEMAARQVAVMVLLRHSHSHVVSVCSNFWPRLSIKLDSVEILWLERSQSRFFLFGTCIHCVFSL